MKGRVGLVGAASMVSDDDPDTIKVSLERMMISTPETPMGRFLRIGIIF